MNARHLAERVSNRITKQVALRWGRRLPLFYVAEYPKSGGTWLAHMLAGYLGVPFPQHSIRPVLSTAVLHNLWNYDQRFDRPIYLYRDGRDVMVSLFYDRIRVARHADRPGSSRVAATYRKVFGEYGPQDITMLLPRFIEFEFDTPGRGASVSWRDHVMDWTGDSGRAGVTYVSYEELRADCDSALGRVLTSVTGKRPDMDRVSESVERFTMEAMTGRRPGQTDVTSHVRRGVPGEWRTAFNRESAQLFDELAGDALIALGYEADRSWVSSAEQ